MILRRLSFMTYLCIVSFLLQAQEVTQIPFPVKDLKVSGIAFDGTRLQVLDTKETRIVAFDRELTKQVSSKKISEANLKGLAFDGKLLWTADEKKKQLLAIDPVKGKIQRTLDLPIPEGKGFDSVEGLAWDGTYLWVALFAGYSSTYNQIDVEKGTIVKSVFADCNPRGIVSNGKYLWGVCYNGENLPAKIEVRPVEGKSGKIVNKRRFIADIKCKRPQGIAFDGTRILINDAELGVVFAFTPEEK